MAETKKRIIQYNEETTPALDDYLIMDSPTAGTRKILASNVGGGGNANVVELTYAQYMALTPAERINGTIYCVTDDPNDSNVHIPVNYSTAEQDTGLKWIDSKPIYQKTIAYTTSVSLANLNIDEIVDIKGVSYLTDGTVFLLNTYGSNQYNTNMDITNDTLTITTNGWAFSKANVTILYTKTTD